MSRSRSKLSLPTPHLDSLDARESRFVIEYVALGSAPNAGAQAALRAGYDKIEKDARLTAAILLGSKKITSAIKQEVTSRFSAAAGAALATVLDLAVNATSEQVRLSAAKELLDRGIGPIISRNANINASVGIEDILAMLDRQDASQPLPSAIEAKPIGRSDD